jgi:hypothetical protein
MTFAQTKKSNNKNLDFKKSFYFLNLNYFYIRYLS